jgi:ArsR family transcriptional regulator, arsenate/arsenite/antimonite-responsive transcriptional repressor / arsenate reductase (thioredoxin)
LLTFNAAQRPKEVLFLCRDNGARSLIAEAILNSFSGGGMRAFSAGVESRKDIPMPITQVIESRGVSIKGLRPKLWSEFDGLAARKLDFVFSICDPEVNEVCAYWPGQPLRAHWHIAEPLEQKDVNEYYRLLDETFDHLLRCVNGFLNLPFEVMEKFALQRQNGDPDARLVPGRLPVTAFPARVRAAS